MSAEPEVDEAEDIFDSDLFIDKSYQLKVISVGDLELQLYALHKAASTDHDLTGQIVWPAAQMLSHYLIENADLCRNAGSILELGSGAGLSGLIAAKLSHNPAQVLLTDNNQLVLDLLQMNIRANFSSESASPRCMELCWGSTGLDELSGFTEGFDVILGADVVFWPQAVPLLFQTVQQLLLKKPSAVFVLSYVNRSNYSTDLMFNEANKCHLQWKSVDLSAEIYQQLLKKYLLTEKTAEILIFTLKDQPS